MANFPITPVNGDSFTDDSSRVWEYEDGMWLNNGSATSTPVTATPFIPVAPSGGTVEIGALVIASFVLTGGTWDVGTDRVLDSNNYLQVQNARDSNVTTLNSGTFRAWGSLEAPSNGPGGTFLGSGYFQRVA